MIDIEKIKKYHEYAGAMLEFIANDDELSGNECEIILSLVCAIFLNSKQRATMEKANRECGDLSKEEVIIVRKKIMHDFFMAIDLTMGNVKEIRGNK